MQKRSSTPRLDRLYGGYLLAADGEVHDSETFTDWERWLVEEGYHGSLEPLHSTNSLKQRIRDIEDARTSPTGRAFLTKHDPLSFLLTVVPKLLEHPDTEEIGFNDMEFWACREAYLWQWRYTALRRQIGNELPDRFVAAIIGRGMNKTGMLARGLPLWAAAHGHTKLFAFAAANKDKLKETQNWWLDELEGNDQLITDFPDFVTQLPKKSGFIDTVSGFTMVTRSLNMEWRGTNAHGRRPDLGVTDDIDAPDEGGIEDRVKMLNADYRFTGRSMRAYLLGTNRSPGNITDSLLTKYRRGQEAAPEWTTPWRPIHFSMTPVSRITGKERSVGEAFYRYDDGTPDCLVRLRREDPAYGQELENEPYAADGVWWRPENIHLLTREQVEARFTLRAVSVDPAGGEAGNGGSAKNKDSTGITVTAFDPRTLDSCIIYSTGGKWDTIKIREEVVKIDQMFRPQIGVWETNFGDRNYMIGTVAPSGRDAAGNYKWVTSHSWDVVAQTRKTGATGTAFPPASKEARFSRFLGLFKTMPPKVFLLGHKDTSGEMVCSVPEMKAQLLAYSHTIKVKGMKDRIDAAATATHYMIERFKPRANLREGTGW